MDFKRNHKNDKAVPNISNSETKEIKEVEPTDAQAALNDPTEGIDSACTLGVFLQEARVKMSYSLNQVAMATKLNLNYIEAMERDDFKNTPPPIYIRAYIKKLCSLYEIKPDIALNKFDSLVTPEKHVSESLIKNLEENKMTNRDEEKKVELVAKVVVGVIATVVVILLISLGYYMFSGSDESTVNPKPVSTVVQKQPKDIKSGMERLIAPQHIVLTELSIP